MTELYTGVFCVILKQTQETEEGEEKIEEDSVIGVSADAGESFNRRPYFYQRLGL